MMRRALLIALPLLMLTGLAQPTPAQTPEGSPMDLKIEMKKKRSVVAPPADTAGGVSEAESAAQKLDEQRRAQELQRKAMPATAPQLDESVTEGIQGKQLQELPKR